MAIRILCICEMFFCAELIPSHPYLSKNILFFSMFSTISWEEPTTKHALLTRFKESHSNLVKYCMRWKRAHFEKSLFGSWNLD